ncbi:hypothetical protein ACFQ1J_07350 [Pedobacter boryungensis]
MSMQLWNIANHYTELPNQLSVKIEAMLMFPMFLLVLVGAYGLFFTKKFGFILYYIQFPFRLYLWVFTLGFITLLPEALNNFEDKWPNILLKVCIMAEFIRLYLTVRGHLKLKGQQ